MFILNHPMNSRLCQALVEAGEIVKDVDIFTTGSVVSQGSSVMSSSLLEQMRLMSPEGWRRFVRLYTPLVYSWCRRMGLGAHDAADLVQDVFQIVIAKIGDFRREQPGDSFRGWLRTIARNKVCDYWRRREAEPKSIGGSEAQLRFAQQPSKEDSDSIDDEDFAQADEVLLRALDLVREDFEGKTWEAFWQVAVEGRSAADVAADLGISTNAVYIAKCRVLGRVRAEFGELLD